MSWIYLCPECDAEVKVEEEDYPDKCPKCGSLGKFEMIDVDDE